MGRYRAVGRYVPESRFLAGIEKTESSCWLWKRGRTGEGYAAFGINGRKVYVHRFAYELYKGPIPEGMEIDHLCRNRGCVNPEHLEAVTRLINVRRGAGHGGILSRRTLEGKDDRGIDRDFAALTVLPKGGFGDE